MYPTQLHSYLLWRSSVPPDPQSLAQRRYTAIVSLMPAGMVGIFVFGWWAAVVMGISCLTCFITDLVAHKYIYKSSPGTRDGTWLLTGLLLALMMPPNVPLWIPIVAGIIAVFLGKHYFSVDGMPLLQPAAVGLLAIHIVTIMAMMFGVRNYMNPAGEWPVLSRGIETSADSVRGGRFISEFFGGDVRNSVSREEYNRLLTVSGDRIPAEARHGPRPIDLVRQNPSQPLDESAVSVKTSATSDGSPRYGWLEMLLGGIPATIGGSSALALGFGVLLLIFARSASWVLPFFALLTMFSLLHFLSWVYGDSLGARVISANIPVHLLTGSTILGIFYLAADPSTAPRSFLGKVYAGVAFGLIEVFLRTFFMAEGVIISVFVVQGLSFVIDQYLAPPVDERIAASASGLTPSSLGRL